MKPTKILFLAAAFALTVLLQGAVAAATAGGGRPPPPVRIEPKARQPLPPAVTNAAPAAVATRTYQSYTKSHPVTGQVYVGRTSGTGTPAQNIQRRDASHPWTRKGYGPAVLERSSPTKDAIRGREQTLIENNRQAGKAAEQINGISPRNPKREQYMNASKKEFGKP